MFAGKKQDLLALCALGIFFLILGNQVLDFTGPDEVFYAQTAQEMAARKSWLTPYLFGHPQFEKPPVVYWLIRIAMLIPGNPEFNARAAFSLFGLLGALLTYHMGFLLLKERKKAFISGLVLMSSFLYMGIARLLLTDTVFSFFILLALYQFLRWRDSGYKNDMAIALSFGSCGLAALTKGPLGIILPYSAVLLFLLWERKAGVLFSRGALKGMLIFCIISLPWYIFMLNRYGYSFYNEFFYNCHIRRVLTAEHANDTWHFYPFGIIIWMYPWSAFVIPALIRLSKAAKEKAPCYAFIACWILAVFAVFQAAHSKLISYALPLFPALALLIADFISGGLAKKDKYCRWSWVFSWLVIFLPILLTGILLLHLKVSRIAPDKIYIILSAAGALSFLTLFFILKGPCMKAVFAASFAPLLLAYGLFFIYPDIKECLSLKSACSLIQERQGKEDKPLILCSKYLAREALFYTQAKIAVVEPGGRNFFSPHPIPFLNTREKIEEFIFGNNARYCILSKRGFKKLGSILAKKYDIKVIGGFCDNTVLELRQARVYGQRRSSCGRGAQSH